MACSTPTPRPGLARPVPGAGELLRVLSLPLVLTAVAAAWLLPPGSAAGLVSLALAMVLVLAAALPRRPWPQAPVQARGDAAGVAVEHARLEARLRATAEELRRSRARLAVAGAEERRRLERELHDSAQNRLVGLQIRLRIALERAEEGSPEIAAMLATLVDHAEEVGAELRRIANGISPPMLASRGLVEALRAEVALSGIPVRVEASPVGHGAPEAESAVYLCCLEAVQNVAKHAGPGATATVRVRRDGDGLFFSVEDDGCGFEPTSANEGSGLTGIRDRLGAVGGWVEVTSSPRGGVIVAGAVPWRPRDL